MGNAAIKGKSGFCFQWSHKHKYTIIGGEELAGMGRRACLMLKKNMFVFNTLEKLFKNSLFM